VLRIRWFDRETESCPIEWPAAALIVATLFLNFVFWLGFADRFWLLWPLPLFALVLIAVVIPITAAFFLLPALAVHRAQRPLFPFLACSLGTVPASFMRLAGAVLLTLWLGSLVALPIWWSGGDYLPWRYTPARAVMLSTALVLFLFATGSQSVRTEAKLAKFTIKLAAAILIAAFLRVEDGWPTILGGIRSVNSERGPVLSHACTELAFYVVPLALFAADFGHRMASRRKVILSMTMGAAVPLIGTLLLVAMIDAATGASSMYQPSLNPTVFMALWAHVRGSALPGRMMIVALTMFGAARFGVRGLGIVAPDGRWKWIALGGCGVGVILKSLHANADLSVTMMEFPARCLAAASAVVACDFLCKRTLPQIPKRVDWVACLAVLAGIALPAYYPLSPDLVTQVWSHPWTLRCYVVVLVLCLCGRGVEKLRGGREGRLVARDDGTIQAL